MITRYIRAGLCLTLAAACLAPTATRAQDRRQVNEPSLPDRICAKLAPAGRDDWQALQNAINRCGSGQAVHLTGEAGRNVFVSGPLVMKSGVSLWIDRGVVLAATTDPAAYDLQPGVCGTLDDRGRACRPFLTFKDYAGGGIYGDGIIDGQGGQAIGGKGESWWQLARRAQAEKLRQNVPQLIQIANARDITFYRITLRNSPNFHVAMNGVQGATFWAVKIDTPADARNTDGIDPGSSQDVTIAHSYIRTGDDNVAIKAGHNGPTHHVSIIDNHFYWGHGMSIGSETLSGVHDILIRGLTLDGTTAGLRIKSDVSRGGLVQHILYEDICLRANRWAVYFDTNYGKDAQGANIPVYRDITLRHVTGRDGQLVLQGYDSAHALDIMLDGVHFAPDMRWDVSNARLRAGPLGASPVLPEGGPPATDSAHDCSARFVPFPGADS